MCCFSKFFIPIRLIDLVKNSETLESLYQNGIFRFNSNLGLNILGIVIFSVILGVVIFSELQNNRANNHIHSLPFSKGNILINKILVGITLLIVSCLINILLCYFITFNAKYFSLFKIDILKYYILVFVLSLIFLCTVFCFQ
ncbi:ABC transporter permease [Caloramator sp. mosi_1]|uniref:ABC transporter permease n=1 Tax=Caloramator sp. mosi_1 TaxID=3023090 RepID=UPI003FCC9FFF